MNPFTHPIEHTARLYRRLRRQARAWAKEYGHDMTPFHQLDKPDPLSTRIIAESKCRRCGAWVRIETHPAPNSIDVSGSVGSKLCH